MKEQFSPELLRYQQQKLHDFIEKNVNIKTDSIVFSGDSIVEFFPLKKYFGRSKNLLNRGIAGTDTNWLKEHLQEQVLAAKPYKLFILIGTNDLGLGYEENHILNNIQDILSCVQVESIATQIYVLSILPVSEKKKYKSKVKIRKNSDIKSINIKLSQLMISEFIDLYPLLLDLEGNLADDYTTDGLHLSQKGYEIISNYLQNFL